MKTATMKRVEEITGMDIVELLQEAAAGSKNQLEMADYVNKKIAPRMRIKRDSGTISRWLALLGLRVKRTVEVQCWVERDEDAGQPTKTERMLEVEAITGRDVIELIQEVAQHSRDQRDAVNYLNELCGCEVIAPGVGAVSRFNLWLKMLGLKWHRKVTSIALDVEPAVDEIGVTYGDEEEAVYAGRTGDDEP